jgi:transcriptional regulator with XRE-family HTH domain
LGAILRGGIQLQTYERTNLRRELDEALLPFRLAKGRAEGGWLLGVRQAIGMPVDDLARQMRVSRWAIHRMERSEQSERILLSTLRRAADGLGCELVYGLVPKNGTLEELASAQAQARKIAAEKKHRKRLAAKKPLLEAIGWQDAWMQALRAQMRGDGYRVRPAKTERNVENQIEEFGLKLKMMQMAGALGPFVKQFLEEQEARKREREGVVEVEGGEEMPD